MSKPPAPSDAADKFMLRMPDGMRDRIAELARANKRSMNAEIVARLESSMRVDDLLDAKDENMSNHQILAKALQDSADFAIKTGKRIRVEISYIADEEMPDFPPKARTP